MVGTGYIDVLVLLKWAKSSELKTLRMLKKELDVDGVARWL